MSELKVGDRVELIGDICEKGINIGDTGTVVRVWRDIIGVELDRNIGGHSCSGLGRDGYCWNFLIKELKKR